MKAVVLGLVVCLGAAFVAAPVSADVEAERKEVVALPHLPAETELVASFYRVLLQEYPPTLEQEESLFIADSGLRSNLIEAQGQDASQPLVMNLCREHRELFLPRNRPEHKGAVPWVTLSTPITFPRRLDFDRDRRPNDSYVIAFFPRDMTERPLQWREIWFTVENGRIDPDGIQLEGLFSGPGEFLAERFMKWPDTE